MTLCDFHAGIEKGCGKVLFSQSPLRIPPPPLQVVSFLLIQDMTFEKLVHFAIEQNLDKLRKPSSLGHRSNVEFLNSCHRGQHQL